MNRKTLHLLVLIPAALLSAGLRIWNLRQGVDAAGLLRPDHISTLLLVALYILGAAALALLSAKNPCRSGSCGVISRGKGGAVLLAAGVLILLGALLEWLGAPESLGLRVLGILGLAAGICMILTALLRSGGSQKHPWTELVPVVYLVVRLVLNFKSWSVDPIILDYFPALFALIFAMLGFYGCAGFVFDNGAPRKTLFCCSMALVFCATAAAESVEAANFGGALSFLGMLLWLAVPMLRLLDPTTETGKPRT